MTKNHPDIPCRRYTEKLLTCLRRSPCPDREIPLSRTCCRGKVKICRLGGDRKSCARMASLGLVPGRELELLCPRRGGGQCLIKMDGGTLSLDSSLAENVFVKESR